MESSRVDYDSLGEIKMKTLGFSGHTIGLSLKQTFD